MMNELVPYLFAGTDDAEEAPTPVRVVVRGEVPWFVAADICRVLGLTNPSKALSVLDDEEKCIVDLRGQADTLTNREGIRRNTLTDSDTLSGQRGNPKVNVVSESGLYALIFRSRKPAARKFRRWVTEEVLPSIRRTGRYENTVPVGRHPQGPSLTLTQIEASLHQHQMRVLAAVRSIAEDGRASVSGFGQIADLSGLSVPAVRRAVRLLVSLGFIEVNDQSTAGKLIEAATPQGHA